MSFLANEVLKRFHDYQNQQNSIQCHVRQASNPRFENPVAGDAAGEMGLRNHWFEISQHSRESAQLNDDSRLMPDDMKDDRIPWVTRAPTWSEISVAKSFLLLSYMAYSLRIKITSRIPYQCVELSEKTGLTCRCKLRDHICVGEPSKGEVASVRSIRHIGDILPM